MASSEDLYRCEVCLGQFSTATAPLVLPCGHTFCRSCVATMHQRALTQHGLKCPLCRQHHRITDPTSLPINYILLQHQTRAVHASARSMCDDHKGDLIRFWCKSCDKFGCGTCMYHSHSQGHHQVLDSTQANAVVQERLQKTIKKLQQDRNNDLKEVNQVFHNLQSHVVNCLNLGYQQCVATDQMLKLKRRLFSMHTTNDKESSKDTTESCEDAGDGASGGQQQRCTGGSTNQEEQELRFGSWSLKGDEGGLLLQPVPTPARCPLALSQLGWLDCLVGEDLEVFLELSAGQVVLGRVVIKLWAGLRLSQQFLALCLGTLGPTYLNSRLVTLWLPNTSLEMVVAGSYNTQEGWQDEQALLKGLEWGDQWAALYREGLVVAYDPYHTLFGICTNPMSMITKLGPFGEVVEGMEVVRQCKQYTPISEVTISGCGLLVRPEMLLEASD